MSSKKKVKSKAYGDKHSDLVPVLEREELYYGYNGRIFCGKLSCSGMSAHFTERDISGQSVEIVGAHDARIEGLVCEGCGWTYGRESGATV